MKTVKLSFWHKHVYSYFPRRTMFVATRLGPFVCVSIVTLRAS